MIWIIAAEANPVAKVRNNLILTNNSELCFQPEVEFVPFEYRFHDVVAHQLCQQMFGCMAGEVCQPAVSVQR